MQVSGNRQGKQQLVQADGCTILHMKLVYNDQAPVQWYLTSLQFPEHGVMRQYLYLSARRTLNSTLCVTRIEGHTWQGVALKAEYISLATTRVGAATKIFWYMPWLSLI